jgi:PAS domain S-box-containing protein
VTLSTTPQSLQDVGITELLEEDCRPTFIIDLKAPEKNVNGRMNVVFCNKSLRFFDELRNVVLAETFFPSTLSPNGSPDSLGAADAEFKDWATGIANFDGSTDGYLPRHTFRGMFWTSCTLRSRWRVVSASQVPNQRRKSHGTPRSSRSTSRSTSTCTVRSSASERADLDLHSVDFDLSKQLADSESKFKVLTELNPVGMYYLSPDGNVVYANDMWYEITGHPRGLEGDMSFMNVISESDHPLITKEWEILTTEKGRRTFELRLRKPWFDEATGTPRQKWILASCDQEFDEDGKLKSIMGCITDISAQKHVEENAVERANLVEKLALRTQEAAEHEKNFQQMAELAPCGMFTFDPEGRVTWANSQWYEMTGHSRNLDEHCPMSFLNFIEQHDHEAFHNDWQKLTVAKEEVNSELRLVKPWIRQESNEAVRDTTWILFLALPQLDDDGNLIKVFGCTTVSHLEISFSRSLSGRIYDALALRNLNQTLFPTILLSGQRW